MLQREGRPLVTWVAELVAEAAGSATLVGPQARYGELGWPVVEDERPGEGPLGGLLAALGAAREERCLIVACDMPSLTVEALKGLVEQPVAADVVMAGSERGGEPLCAVYRTASLPVLRKAFAEGERSVRKALKRLKCQARPLGDPQLVYNANTPLEWAAVEAGG